MLRTPIFALTALAFVCAASAAFAAPSNGYVPKRTILQQTDVPGSNMTVILAETDIEANQTAARHTHPGVEISYVLAGAADFIVEGKGTFYVAACTSICLNAGMMN